MDDESSVVSSSRTSLVERSQSLLELARTVELSYPAVKAGCDVSFDEIWQLFLDSGFLYPEKVARLQPVIDELRHTVRTLLDVNGSLMATIVLRNEPAIDAHMSVLRFYDRTWIVQHLAARPMTARRLDASARLTLGFTYYGRLRPDIEWVKMFFRPNNPWPARVFGGYASKLRESPTSDVRTFHYLPAATHAVGPTAPADIEVRAAVPGDVGAVAHWFTARGRTTEVAANDLEPARFHVSDLGAEFGILGLTRRRECLVAERHGRLAGFALLEVAALGMNFSELTNAFTVHLLDDDTEARRALILAAKARYRELGRAQCVALEEGDELAPFEAAGFARVKDYTCWTFHREHLEGMEHYFMDLFGARRR